MYQARELVAQCHILGDEICTVLENGSNHGEKGCELERHLENHSLSPDAQKRSAKSRSYRIMTMHNAPKERPIELREIGAVVALPRVGGLHHRYTRKLQRAA